MKIDPKTMNKSTKILPPLMTNLNTLSATNIKPMIKNRNVNQSKNSLCEKLFIGGFNGSDSMISKGFNLSINIDVNILSNDTNLINLDDRHQELDELLGELDYEVNLGSPTILRLEKS